MKNKDGNFTSKFQMDPWQTDQSHKMFRRIQKFQRIQKLQLTPWQSQIKWKCQERSSRHTYEDEPDVFGPASVSENPYRDFLKLWLQPSLLLLCFQFSLVTFITPYNQPQRNNLLLIGDAREAIMTITQPWKEGLNFHLRYIFI